MFLVFIDHDKSYHTKKKRQMFRFSHLLATKQTRESRNPKQCEMEISQKYIPSRKSRFLPQDFTIKSLSPGSKKSISRLGRNTRKFLEVTKISDVRNIWSIIRIWIVRFNIRSLEMLNYIFCWYFRRYSISYRSLTSELKGCQVRCMWCLILKFPKKSISTSKENIIVRMFFKKDHQRHW